MPNHQSDVYYEDYDYELVWVEGVGSAYTNEAPLKRKFWRRKPEEVEEIQKPTFGFGRVLDDDNS